MPPLKKLLVDEPSKYIAILNVICCEYDNDSGDMDGGGEMPSVDK